MRMCIGLCRPLPPFAPLTWIIIRWLSIPSRRRPIRSLRLSPDEYHRLIIHVLAMAQNMNLAQDIFPDKYFRPCNRLTWTRRYLKPIRLYPWRLSFSFLLSNAPGSRCECCPIRASCRATGSTFHLRPGRNAHNCSTCAGQ